MAKHDPHSLEGKHIRDIVVWSVGALYGLNGNRMRDRGWMGK